ncbi:MAG: sugar transferase [Novosphingobium sp.]
MNSLMPVQAEAWTPNAALSSYPTAGVATRLAAAPRPPAPVAFRKPLPQRQAVVITGNGRAIRVLDIIGASAALLLLSPIMLLTALAIMLLDPGPLLFAHTRLGQGGRPFRCLKFRSMTVDADARLALLLETDADARAEWQETQKLRHDPRITPVGRFLRRSCLDELPQLFNVLLGEMSLVGPRPIVAGEALRYGRHFPVYCSLKPGITGLWQVKRQDQTSYRRRVAFDLAYARSRSLALNLRILVLTVPCVLRGEGAC